MEGKVPNGRKGNKVLIDDVHDYLEAEVKAAYFDPQSTVQNKMQEIIVALKNTPPKGCTESILTVTNRH